MEKNTGNHKKYFSTSEFAHMLGVTRQTVFAKIKSGEIRAEKIGRNYAIPVGNAGGFFDGPMTDERKAQIKKAVDKAVKEYGQTLRLLGKE